MRGVEQASTDLQQCCSIEGRVVDDQGVGIPYAAVRLSLIDPSEKPYSLRLRSIMMKLSPVTFGNSDIVLTADSTGGFRANLQPGRYLAVAAAEGFQKPVAPLNIEVSERSSSDNSLQRLNIIIQLKRLGALSGKVLLENEKPASRVIVSAFSKACGPHDNVVGTVYTGRTDDRGMFRLFDLPPGEYKICALPRLELFGDRASEYVCWPNTSDAFSAMAINLKPSEELSVPVMRVRRSRLTVVEVEFDDHGDHSVAGVEILQVPDSSSDAVGFVVPSEGFTQHSEPSAGKRVFRMAPGTYVAIVRIMERSTRRPIAFGAEVFSVARNEGEEAQVPSTKVRVPTVPLRKLTIRLECTVDHTCEELTKARPTLLLYGQSLNSKMMGSYPVGTLITNDTVEINAALGDLYKLVLLDLPPDIYVRRVSPAPESARLPLLVDATVSSEVVVEISPQAAKLSVERQNDPARRATEKDIIVRLTDASTGEEVALKRVQEENALIGSLAPGTYNIFVAKANDLFECAVAASEWTKVETLTLSAGEQRSVILK